MSDPEFSEKADPEEAFTALADDNRIAILRALWEADGHEASFSQLRDAVGMRDSGQFNYHLDKLVGTFVAKTETGYELTEAGTWVNGAIERGSYTLEGSLEPITLDHPCRTCGDTRTLYYEGETVRIECETCPVKSQFALPPSVLIDVGRDEIPEVAGRYLRSMFQHLDNSFCWYCDGRVEVTVEPAVDPDEEPPEDAPDGLFEQVVDFPVVRYDCRRCGASPVGGLSQSLLDHPAVVAFHSEQDKTIDGHEIWEYAAIDTDRARIRSRDPFQAVVTYREDGETLSVVVDDSLSVVDVDR
ncbi:HTH domain protein [Halalkaliarchaeum desulfuricum]|uniref:HTH domain protein n=1 Tax=Halalkaliarchaeum desulfuricum TaxID=2055893 RepID=A0A343TIC2_9EURY|nr:helix-turn-helix domain-containing protein [Halalkaliarchaeum desulfuricum]AUX08844.1 HTH domain protein [Halalkaliarchaeum desulfuricum]